MKHYERRQIKRHSKNLPIQIGIGTQIIINGQIRDISAKSAFIYIKNSVYFQQDDELNFKIENFNNGSGESIEGTARISRIEPGEGIAIYFTGLDEESSEQLSQLSLKTT